MVNSAMAFVYIVWKQHSAVMENTIPTRILDFLKQYLPFSLLSEKTLLGICETVVVRYLQPSEIVFRQGATPDPFVYVVRDGAIKLLREESGSAVLVDECDEGDLFGLRPLLAEQEYWLTAQAVEETLLYAIRIDVLQPLLEEHPKVAWYMVQNFAAGLRNRMAEGGTLNLASERTLPNDEPFHLLEVQSISRRKPPVTCSPDSSIREAAQIMRDQRVGSIIIVSEALHPLGIITDKDLRNEVVAGTHDLVEPVTAIMSQPVVCMPADCTVADVQIAMMQRGIHHLCLTETGRSDSKVLGVVSEHDLLVLQGNNPAVFVREIRRSDNSSSLRRIREKAEQLLAKYLQQEVAIHFIANVMTQINDALINRVIEMSRQELTADGKKEPDLKWCWLALGSEGREEQLLRTDQDNALVFEDVAEADYAAVKDYFLSLARRVNELLAECGFEYCPADMMAGNPAWCLSLSEWKKQFSTWILSPTEKNVMYCTIFFDYRPVYGHAPLADALTEHIFETIRPDSVFLSLLARNALRNPPPLTFFRNFVVEKSGEHKDEFDIKGRAMMPLADTARLLVLNARQSRINNTFQRFDRMAELEPQNRELFQQAADAYEILMRYRTLQGLQNTDSGRFFKPAELTKMERLNLRNSCRPINELHDLLKVRFRTGMLG
ncbi:MAG: CBS domain-containing protein [Lewinella sp.]|nr:CBS domain-containing protein [Lewinella sp.]